MMDEILTKEFRLYSNEYFTNRRDPRRETAYRQDAEKIRARMGGEFLAVDFGGGYGEFGKYLDCVYHCYDPFTGYDELPDVQADVAIFRGVLQHIYNPVEMLAFAYDHLLPGGLLAVLATPDTDSIGYLRFGTLPALDAPRNWIPFGHRMLGNVLTRLGFVGIELAWPYGKPYARPLRDLWNFAVGKPCAFPGNMMECFARKNDQ